jgi:hypothetical protein
MTTVVHRIEVLAEPIIGLGRIDLEAESQVGDGLGAVEGAKLKGEAIVTTNFDIHQSGYALSVDEPKSRPLGGGVYDFETSNLEPALRRCGLYQGLGVV